MYVVGEIVESIPDKHRYISKTEVLIIKSGLNKSSSLISTLEYRKAGHLSCMVE
ncbi:hypothetical protein J31TS4_31260 [Paenibacillus sp. J31TS4]|nr:hypothetical protein J31TS4_31260 [Paenibacillus sp. J31TS4]